MNGYLDAISDQYITIRLGGRDLVIPRARLGLHIRLSKLVDEFEQAPGCSEIAQAIHRYFEALGLDISAAHPVEVLASFAILKQANAWQWSLAFMQEPGAKDKPEAYDYPDRNWSWVVHKLASRYGWTRHYIMDLWPEEAGAYLQEILVSEMHEAEERHSLSELAYKYDSVSKTSRYVPIPRPSWMLPKLEFKPVKMLRSMLPYGVQDLAGKEITYH